MSEDTNPFNNFSKLLDKAVDFSKIKSDNRNWQFNPYLNEVVKICSSCKNKRLNKIIDTSKVLKFRSFCLECEKEMELSWSKLIIDDTNSREKLKEFPYLDNYQKIVDLEISVLRNNIFKEFKNICFVGGGPLPLTAILLAEKLPDTNFTVYDNNKESVRLSKQLCLRLGVKNVKIDFGDAFKLKYEKFDLIFLAAMVDGEKSKEFLINKINKLGLPVVTRSASGYCELCYKPIDVSKIKGQTKKFIFDEPIVNDLILVV